MTVPVARRAEHGAGEDGGSRERILDAALHLVARYGVNGMSLQLLADHVGLHKSTLFHHFAGKGELAVEVMKRVMADVVERIEPLETAEPPEIEQFVAIVCDLDDFFAEHKDTALFVMRVILGPGDEFYKLDLADPDDLGARLFHVVGGWLNRAREAGVVRSLDAPHTIVNLMAQVLFFPALVDVVDGDELPLGDPRAPEARRARKRELREALRRALSP